MDVRCERCSTEYEFDDALVSGRGTTVKCTNCGHKFKIRRSDGDFSEDFWNIQTGDGRTLVFTSLRELQRAIQTNLVAPNALLSRGGLQQKPIGQIPELAPFFDQRDARAAPPITAPVAAVAPPRRSSRPPPPLAVASPFLAPPPRQRMSTRPDFPPSPVEKSDRPPALLPPPRKGAHRTTLMGTGGEDSAPHVPVAAPAPGARRASEAPQPTEREPDTERFARQASPQLSAKAALTRTQPIAPPVAPVVDVLQASTAPAFEASSPLPLPLIEARASSTDDDHESRPARYPDNPNARLSSPTFGVPSSMGGRRPVGGYLIAAVVLAGALAVGAMWAKDHLGGYLGKARAAPAVTTDPRVASFLAAGEKALTDGNLEASKESFDKASALAEKDPRVLLDVARLAAVRADTPWLKSRLLVPEATDEIRATKDSLGELSAAARKAADDALAVAPDDAGAWRAKIDALRIAGDRAGARALASKLSSSAAQPETAYVLAALDLADPEPLWSTVLERLRVAANAESGPGRARATLAYALAQSGDITGAKAEVERLASLSRQHPLLPLLRFFANSASPTLRVDSLPDAGPLAARDGARGPRDKQGRGLSNDARLLVQQGDAARAKGDFDRAQMLFAAALDRNPNGTEALNGLAAIAHSRRDLNGARASYKRVLSINPSYVPALVGLGDVEFESGDRASAMKTYKDIVERFPEGTYPARVKQRIEPATAPLPSSSGAAPGPAPSDNGGGG